MPVPSQGITVFTVFRLLTDFVCLYTYEFWLSLCKIARSSVILLLPLSTTGTTGTSRRRMVKPTWRKRRDCHQQSAFETVVDDSVFLYVACLLPISVSGLLVLACVFWRSSIRTKMLGCEWMRCFFDLPCHPSRWLLVRVFLLWS
jgi:hypothetical protein